MAAAAALSAHTQGKFLDFHHRLFENYKALNNIKIQEIAQELELDMGKFKKDMSSPSLLNLITRDMGEGRKAGIRGTPTMFLNGKITRSRSLQDLIRVIENELNKGAPGS